MSATVIERVQVSGSELDPLTARLRLERALAAVEMRPRGLPAAAWLYVRALSDPLPGGLALESSIPRASPAWEQACRGALESALRNAARPARESVPADAQAVVFYDEAELLACLARDELAGVAATRWWWRRLRARLLSGRGGTQSVSTAWLSAPEHVPAALELLGHHDAVEVSRRIPARSLHVILDAVCRAFGAEALRRAITSGTASPATRDVRLRLRPAGSHPPPWRRVAPEASEAGPSPEHELFLGVALSLRRAPAAARASQFARDVEAWLRSRQSVATTEDKELEAAPDGERARPAPPSRSPTARVGTQHRLAGDDDPSHVAHAPDARVWSAAEDEVGPETASRRPGSRQGITLGREDGKRLTEVELGGGPASAARSGSAVGAIRATTAATGEHSFAPTPRLERAVIENEERASSPGTRTSPDKGVSPMTAPAREHGRLRHAAGRGLPGNAASRGAVATPVDVPLLIHTELGGIFYLLNLAQFLGLYGDFTSPREPGIALSPWDFLTLIGRTLIGRSYRDDPIWPLLARLAERDAGAPPGVGFRAPTAWRLPSEWLAPFGSAGEWWWSAAGGTLRIIHPAGFPAVAVSRRRSTAAGQLARELTGLRRRLPQAEGLSIRRAALRPEPPEPLMRWTHRLAAYADARLRLALGMTAGTRLADLLLARSARILLTHTHVEIIFALHELPLAVRFAGLDRTPGWLPAAGRFVAFEFE